MGAFFTYLFYFIYSLLNFLVYSHVHKRVMRKETHMLQSTQVLKLKNAVRSTLGSMALNDLQQVGVLDDVLALMSKLEPQAGVKSTLTSLNEVPVDKQEQPASQMVAEANTTIKRKRSPKRSYPEKVRNEFSRLLSEEAKSVPAAARKLGINIATAYGWKSAAAKSK